METNTMKILLINGSHRAGNTDLVLARVVAKLASLNIEYQQLILRDVEMQYPDGCEDCANLLPCPNIQDKFATEIEPTLREYNLYIIATPSYCDAVTPLLKTFFDRIVFWCHEDRNYWSGKKMALIVHGMADENSWNSIDNWLQGVCRWSECHYQGSLQFHSNSKVGQIDIADEQIDQFIRKIII